MSDVKDNEYVTPGSGVVKDDAPIDEPKVQDPDSDAQIEKDEKEAIDESNIIDEKTRGAQPKGSYEEKEEDDLPAEVENDGTSRGAAT